MWDDQAIKSSIYSALDCLIICKYMVTWPRGPLRIILIIEKIIHCHKVVKYSIRILNFVQKTGERKLN